jgi:predicted DNA-binding antitoxin AbrB/MazE fold protein
MTNRIEAVYENGVFRPKVPVQLREGTTAQVTFEEGAALKPPQPLVAALEEIARMPEQGPADGFSGANHDDVLYGPEGAR